MIRSKENYFGAWAFLIGVVLAISVGILGSGFGGLSPYVLGLLALIGFFVGFVNVSDKDVQTFLMAAVSLVIVSFAGINGIKGVAFIEIPIGQFVSGTLGALLVLLVPATIVVALKSLFSISSQK